MADTGNNSIRHVTMAGVVSTVTGNGGKGCADGTNAAARFKDPSDVVVDTRSPYCRVILLPGR